MTVTTPRLRPHNYAACGDWDCEDMLCDRCGPYAAPPESGNGHAPKPLAAAGGNGTSVASIALVATAEAAGGAGPELAEAAYYGPIGSAALAVAPYTEADPAGVLVQLLAGYGSVVGAGPHVKVDRNRHPARIFPVVVGDTAVARKGSGWSWARDILAELDPTWAETCVRSGLSSGEGLISDLADENTGDHRRLVVEQEYARVLKMCEREGNILSTVIRELWDGGDARTMTRRDRLEVKGAHLTIISHVTADELRRKLSETEQANGFANRFLYAYVRRTQCLPFGGGAPDGLVADIAGPLRASLDRARRIEHVVFDEAAKATWERRYRTVWAGRDGLVGAVTARGVAQLLRLSVAYALADGVGHIAVDHIEAAYAVWRYCEDSAAHVFGDATGDRTVDTLLDAIRARGDVGMDGTEQRDLFSRHAKGTQLEEARQRLEDRGLIRTIAEQTGGRPRLVSYPITPGDQSDLGDQRSR